MEEDRKDNGSRWPNNLRPNEIRAQIDFKPTIVLLTW